MDCTRTTVCWFLRMPPFKQLSFAFSPQSPENQERKSKLTEYEKEKASKSDRKRVSAIMLHLIMLVEVRYRTTVVIQCE